MVKKIILLSFFIVSSNITAQSFQGWNRKQAITINNNLVEGTLDLVDFPFLVTLDHLDSEIVDGSSNSALNGGGDIRFSSDAAGNNRLAVEVVEFVTDATVANRKCQVWVKITSLSATANTTIFVWYNKAGEAQPVTTDTYGSQAVWSNYHFVSHDGLYDSATNQYLTVNGSPTTGLTPYGGQSWKGNGTSDYTYLPDGGIDLSGNVSISIWKKNTAVTTNFGHSLSLGNASGWISLLSYGAAGSEARTWFASEIQSTNYSEGMRFFPASNQLGWHYFSISETTLLGEGELMRGDGTASTLSPSNGYSWSKPTQQNQIMMGNRNGATNYLHGELAEARISLNIISPEFLDTDYNNMSNSGAFALAGTPEAATTPDTQTPTAPTLSSTSQTDTTVDLSWTTATDDVAVTGYKVYKDAVLETTLGNVSAYQVTGLTAASGYNFTVTALDAAGNESAVSNTLTINSDSPSTQEFYTMANAANSIAEVNATTGTSTGSTNFGVTSVSSTPTAYNGTYSLKFTHAGPDNTLYYRRIEVTGLTIGETYEVHIWGNRISGGNFQLSLRSYLGWTESTYAPLIGGSTTANTWYEYILTGIASSTTAYIDLQANTNADTGNAFAIDNISIIKVDTTIPTVPTLSSTSQTDTTVDLGWTDSTDDTAVTGYKVYKDGVLETTLGNVSSYEVTGLTAATAYSFTVTALDAAGNESVVSNTLAIITNPASGGGGSGHWSLNNQDVYYTNGNVGIGTTTPDEKLAVNGNIHAKEVRVDLNDWPDYVFMKDYKLPSLKEVENHIKTKGHLANMPSAQEVEENGVKLGEMHAKLLEKIEELTLYILQLKKELDVQKEQIKNLEKN